MSDNSNKDTSDTNPKSFS
ncbi:MULTISPECIES: hypothetical protein [Bizionia]|uniref:Uncharacterized protein n=1 Tax=Bizionia hallyeonensis TaxID=1123757 RepID=A0ABW0C7Q4_9FLAO